jgi:hypothetical protein
MAVIAPADRRLWVPLAAGAVMVAIVTAAALTGASHHGPGRSGSTDGGAVGVPALEQADWKISVRPAGVIGKLPKSDKKKLDKQRHALRGLVRDVYGALFLNPERVDNVLAARFSKTSEVAFKRADAGIPKQMTNVSTKKRRASISVQASGSKRAVASITVVATGVLVDREVKISHSARLWLERTGKHWKIIAFDVDQRPVK